MRRLTFVLFIVLLPRSLAAEALLVGPPITTLVAATDQLVEMCGASGTYDACTRFVAYRLEASCYESNGAWAIDATATFRPFIVLRNIRQLQHEQEHIGDVRTTAERYLVHLANLRLDSPAACEAAAFAARSSFPERMRAFADASTALRHPRAEGRPTKPLVTGTFRPASMAAASVAIDGSMSPRGRR